ncbi:uncharacterized protein DDB_G0271670 isoform X2 [Drosophila rhopaloa]|uniref:Uncharacterized protein DDB_G0271670 isoform X2 n=1 Tax=Drosophila rhopaloa TaxID=1041015 RepID=A0A6P4EP63_DRORH|nr:uncharacterized protein DDB_G0271670 isoform X2 [Drosophila rhopaloa]
MTFYWWSHWFWITLILSVNLLSSHVHTYPSQEAESVASSPHPQSQPVRTTKLYQTTVTQTWGTATQSNIMDLTHRPTTSRPLVTPSYGGAEQPEVDEVDQAVELQEEKLPLNEREQEQEQEQEENPDQEQDQEQDQDEADPDADADADAEDAAANEELAQYEFKRSADFTSEQLNNFTNFSSSTSTNGSSSGTTTKPVAISSSSPATRTTTTTSRAVASSPTAATSPGPRASASSSTPAAGSAATPSTPKINTEWLSDELLAGASAGAGSGVTGNGEGNGNVEGEGEKAPFTLENANKEDELRRAESEHRSRKSKVLSAEYKHINRYINFSSDTKSLLTRSASAAPSVAGGVTGSGFYDGPVGDEGKFASEALAIQRTYFLDAGAISAICFTVFGVCCTVGTIGIVLYRRRYLNKPQALSEPDSSVYIDDSTMRVSDNSDEMYSLDNDSFLNSLEAMTIQNYWTDTVKHTKL